MRNKNLFIIIIIIIIIIIKMVTIGIKKRREFSMYNLSKVTGHILEPDSAMTTD